MDTDMKEVTPNIRRKVSKLVSGQGGLNANLHRWGLRVDDKCPWCSSHKEMIQQVWKCKHPEVRSKWLKI